MNLTIIIHASIDVDICAVRNSFGEELFFLRKHTAVNIFIHISWSSCVKNWLLVSIPSSGVDRLWGIYGIFIGSDKPPSTMVGLISVLSR